MIYEPREDSFLLEKYVKKYSRGKVLDVGCGSGILMEAALEKTKDVLGVDINKEAVEFCKSKGINARVSDLFSKVKGKFDLIILNPPYLPEDKEEDKESKLITSGGREGYEILERFFSEVKNFLNKNGKILIVVSSLTNLEKVKEIINKSDFKFKILEEKKLFFETLYVLLVLE